MAQRIAWTAFKYLLALGLLGYVVYANWEPPSERGLRQVWQAHVIERLPIEAHALLIGLLLTGAALLVTVYRWYLLMRAQDLPITWSATLRIGLLGFFFNTFLPGSVGGDIVKAAAVAREQNRRTTAVATVVMDRFLGLWSLVSFVALVGGIGVLAGTLDGTSGPAQAIIFAALAIVGISIAGWLITGLIVRSGTKYVEDNLRRIPRIGAVVAEFWQVLEMYRRRQGHVAVAIGLSWISDAMQVTAIFCCGLTLWDGLPSNPLPTFTQHFLIVPLGTMVAAIPLFPGGAGINEAGFGGLYGLFGSAPSNGILAALVSRFLIWTIGLLGYLACQCMRPGVKQISAIAETPVGAARSDQVEHATLDALA